VVLSSDVDLNTMEGQATLGHELSHIRAQSMGMGSGRGLLNDASLEHQADSEGMLAARGMNISGETMGMSMGLGMAGVEGLSPVGAGLSASAAAPMQANKEEDEYHKLERKNIAYESARDIHADDLRIIDELKSSKNRNKLAMINDLTKMASTHEIEMQQLALSEKDQARYAELKEKYGKK